ncbi:MAG: phosphate acyltransferase PlsX [Eubacterium sp.]|nr:phosphate acyltransferase PlsX [Eubacterium sp.]
MINIVIDTIGGDNGAEFCVKGAVEGTKRYKNVKIFLVGHKSEIDSYLGQMEYDKDRIEVVDAKEEISPNEAPVKAVREKKDSSLVVGLTLIKDGRADAFISAGSTGAILAGGQFVVGRAKGVKRTPLAHLLPTSGEPALLLDCGANVDVKPEVLLQFAEMGSIYMESVCGVKNPRVALANIGTEEEKGNAQIKATYPLLKDSKLINFTGYIESRAIPYGKADVIVADGFVGNTIIKLYEGLSKMILKELKGAFLSSFTSKLGAMLIKKSMKNTLKRFDASDQGGAPLLGLKGLVVKIHGNSKEGEVISSIRQCVNFVESDVNGKIIKGFESYEEE